VGSTGPAGLKKKKEKGTWLGFWAESNGPARSGPTTWLGTTGWLGSRPVRLVHGLQAGLVGWLVKQANLAYGFEDRLRSGSARHAGSARWAGFGPTGLSPPPSLSCRADPWVSGSHSHANEWGPHVSLSTRSGVVAPRSGAGTMCTCVHVCAAVCQRWPPVGCSAKCHSDTCRREATTSPPHDHGAMAVARRTGDRAKGTALARLGTSSCS
jgi:hypothetical protein